MTSEEDLPFTVQDNIQDILKGDGSEEERLMNHMLNKQQLRSKQVNLKKDKNDYNNSINIIKKDFNDTLSRTKRSTELIDDINIKISIIIESLTNDYPNYKHLQLFKESYAELTETKNNLTQINNEINTFYNNTTTLLYELNENTT